MATAVRIKNEAEWEKLPSEDWDAYSKRTDALMKQLMSVSDALPADQVVGSIVRFPIADGYALYRVLSEKSLLLEHIPWSDKWQIPVAHMRGLRVAEIRSLVAHERAFKKLFGRA